MKIKNVGVSDTTIIKVAKNIKSRFKSIENYELFLIEVNLLSYNPNEYDKWNTLKHFCRTIPLIDERLYIELDKRNILSEETKRLLMQEGVKFDAVDEEEKDILVQKPIAYLENNQNKPKPIPIGTKAAGHSITSEYHISPWKAVLIVLFSFIIVAGILALVIFSLDVNSIALIGSAIALTIVINVLAFRWAGVISDKTLTKIIKGILKSK